MLIVVSTLLAGILILVAVLLAWSPGKPEPFLDENGQPLAGSISEKIFMDINGIKHGMFMKGEEQQTQFCFFFTVDPACPSIG